ncbi:DinB family protein [Solitalea longa]|uniref:DinB family protein n=1 Tax=Solitalea longa TaxID=2079460 RepID=A0A2S5A7B7_9SPHI|nr:DinB family protein [Solitalea longa]POY38406.1 DinB family protein [Solitalea longa]
MKFKTPKQPVFLALVLFVSLLPRVLFAQQISKDEREYVLNYLQKTKTNFLNSIKGLSDAQWHYKADSSRWSIAECAEHIIKAEAMIRGYALDSIMSKPVDPAKKVTIKTEDISAMIEDRSHKAKAPEMLVPKDVFATPADAVKAFEGERQKTIDYIKKTKDDLHGHIGQSPLGMLDAYQFLVLLTAHSARHTKQIEEVKNSPGYPKL